MLNVLAGLVSVCLVASSNYALNEVLDAPTDRMHPQKRHRPIASGVVSSSAGLVEWIALAIVGLGLAALVSLPFFVSALGLWVMALVYNVPPIRSKEVPYLDVLSEAVNNPLRMLMGWYMIEVHLIPPVSLVVAYWMLGCFFMATKRLAEYRHLGGGSRAADYRGSFAHYDESRLLVTVMTYATAAAFFLGIFLIRYRMELILSAPLFAVFMGLYLRIGLKPNSPAMNPERLIGQKLLMIWLAVSVGTGVLLMVVDIPLLAELFQPTP